MIIALTFLAALIVASFLEYAVHRLMHAGLVLVAKHAEHHKDGWGQGFWPELRDYVVPGLPVTLPSWLLGTEVGVGWTSGFATFAVFVAYAHQLQHDNPVACRWMRIPVHYVHHRDQMWHHNFGLSTDLWDRLLGTYRVVPFGEEFTPEQRRRGPLDIRWYRVRAADLEASGVSATCSDQLDLAPSSSWIHDPAARAASSSFAPRAS